MTKKWMLLVLVLSVACTVFAQQKAPAKGNSGNVETHIATLEDESIKAALKGDSSFAEKYLATDYVGISGATGQMVNREESLQNWKSGAVKYQSIDERNRKIRVYGNTAIVNADYSVKGNHKGQDFSGDYRGTRVWVKQGNDWKVVSFQTTPVRAAAAEKK